MKIFRYLVLFILLAGCFPAFGYKHHTIPQMKQYLRMSKDPRKQEKWRNRIREARGKRGKSSRNRYVGGYSYPHWYEYVPAPGGKSYYPNKSYEKLQALRTPEQIKAQTERVKAELHIKKGTKN